MQNCNLATQIKDAVSKHLVLTAIDQCPEVIKCEGIEETVNIFEDAVEKYPFAVWRFPISVAVMSIRNEDLSTRCKRRKLKKLIKSLCPVVRSSLRKSDVVVWYSSYRLAFLLIGSNETEAVRLCQRVKEAVHRHTYLKLKLPHQLDVEFAVGEHNPNNENDLANVIFANERNIRLACAMGEGAVLMRKDVSEHFRDHTSAAIRLGRFANEQIFELND